VDSARFNDRGEGLVEVDPLPLFEAAHNLACLAALQRSIRFELVLEQSLARDDIDAARSWYESSRAVCLEGRELILHGAPPVRVTECSADRRWCE
jgi:hypothetical protein